MDTIDGPRRCLASRPRLFRVLAAAAVGLALIASCSAAAEPAGVATAETTESVEPATGAAPEVVETLVDRYGTNVAAVAQDDRNDILDLDYDRLEGADRQLWIDVYAAETVEGFEKQGAGTANSQATIEATGNATTDTVTITVDVGDQRRIDPGAGELLLESLCGTSSLRWATAQGLSLDYSYADSTGDSLDFVMSEASCEAIGA